jgi:uncharacterized membrane protein YeiH
MFYLLEVIGTMAFAMSGALTAMNKKLDPFGVFIIAFVTAVGGGTLREVMIGSTPVGWMRDLNYVYVIVLGFLLTVVFRKRLDKLRTSLFLFDTIGLGVFTLIGLQKGIDTGLHPVICIALGTMTACFGGVIAIFCVMRFRLFSIVKSMLRSVLSADSYFSRSGITIYKMT